MMLSEPYPFQRGGPVNPEYQVIDYTDTDAKELAALFLEGWVLAPGSHESISSQDDLSYVVLIKEPPK